MRAYQRSAKNRYLAGLVHPDLAVKNGIQLKLYSDIPIPTASVGWHEQYQFTTSSLGTFLLAWKPNFLLDQPTMSYYAQTGWSHLNYNNSASLTGLTSVAGNNFVPSGYTPNISLQRYRMVSALIKVTYNGSVLNQAGTMISCATFDPMFVAVGNSATAVSTHADTLVDRFGNFSLIANGLWNNTVNITETAGGIECLYVPIDPDDYLFERTGYYYGNTNLSTGTFQAQSEGAHINYVVAGRNLPASAQCILVDIYYNYEVIADPSAAPILRSAYDDVWTKQENEKIQDTMSSALRNGSAIRPASNVTFSGVLSDIAKVGIEYLPKLLSLL